ncbi:aquaporin-9 [Gracilinanus agilis]|uniref:aquaporin-9 n=1 Tax=Gracilinanus agilis TaxID=191870 RepID=UPI001CFD7BE7|nr:aquaporin-9 [Gracilinanus agilis]
MPPPGSTHSKFERHGGQSDPLVIGEFSSESGIDDLGLSQTSLRNMYEDDDLISRALSNQRSITGFPITRSNKVLDMDRKLEKSFKEKIILKNDLVKEMIAELLGTFVMVTLGCGSIAQAVLSRWILGQIITINAGFSAAVALGVYVSGGVSGGHINPAVSFTMCFFGRMKWFKLPFYVAAQFVGAFLGAAALFGAYHDALMDFAGGQLITSGENATAHIFATYPVSYLSVPNAFAEQVLSSMFLHLIVFAIFDDKNLRVPKGLEPFAIFMLILVLTCALGMNGAAMNPARDLGPRVFTALAGWGFEVFTAGNHFWWIPVLGPVVGGILGGFIYIYGIEIHHAHPAPGQRLQKVDEKHELSVMM